MHVKASLHNAIAMHPLNKKTEEDFWKIFAEKFAEKCDNLD
jgi:hypothetical protein